MEIHQIINNILGEKYENESSKLAQEFTNKKQLNKSEILFYEGSNPDKLYYLKEGICRAYIIDNEGNEHTTNFFSSPTFIADLSAFKNKTNCKMCIQAITKVEVDYMKISSLIDISEKHLVFHKFFREILENAYLFQQYRQTSFVINDAKTRYIELLNGRIEIFNAVPQKHIASYLGITPQSLSRIRNELK